MLVATLDLMEEGIAVLDEQSNVLHWNKAAAVLTGYAAEDVVRRKCPEDLFRVDRQSRGRVVARTETGRSGMLAGGAGGTSTSSTRLQAQRTGPGDDPLLERPTLVSMRHKMGHRVPGMLRKVALLDSQGLQMGVVLLFYPVEEVDSLPRGESGEGAGVEASQADMEERLDAAHHQWSTGGMPFGLLWITVDQAKLLRKTHGREACEAMLQSVQETLLRQMKPAETLGRWGDNEFLVIAHERSAKLLGEHARRLAGLARIVDFRWWGDRIGLTVSIGASHATDADTLQCLLDRARQAMRASQYAGGNQATEARGE
ncbi:MAG: sensor domain-containing diguanylate cyclase [Acidobacteriaceae bacterium]